MASAKALLGRVVGRLLFREVATLDVHDVAPGFRRIQFGGEGLRSADWEAGDKLQVFLPDHGMRTYTPMTWDATSGELLGYIHGDTPGAQWIRDLRVGDRWQFFGPRRSIRIEDLERRVVLFGDETSFAVARSLADAKGASSLRCVFEVNAVDASTAALGEIGLEAITVQREAAEGHYDIVSEKIARELENDPKASLVMTGRAQSIQAIRARLKERGALRNGKVKAYWSVGKSGLD